jgi:23S rRNA (guanosine2251-2'-O)-methyltransferase
MISLSPAPRFTLLLPDIRSGFNVGALFRSAACFGVEHIFLSGTSPYPPHPEVLKVSLGAEQMVSWSYHHSTTEILAELQKAGVLFVALELHPKAKPIQGFSPVFPLCMILGNEVEGIHPEVLSCTEKILYLPMRGKKESLNVAVAGGIALWELQKHL